VISASAVLLAAVGRDPQHRCPVAEGAPERALTVKAAIAASSFGPKQPDGTPAGSSARTVRPQSGQQSRCKRCSLISTANGGNSATW
jgi:hypothetical protein